MGRPLFVSCCGALRDQWLAVFDMPQHKRATATPIAEGRRRQRRERASLVVQFREQLKNLFARSGTNSFERLRTGKKGFCFGAI